MSHSTKEFAAYDYENAGVMQEISMVLGGNQSINRLSAHSPV
jgi:hypothetical protein